MPADTPVAKPGTSAHERGNALDIQKAPGITADTLRKAFAEKGVTLTKVLSERNIWHIEWGKKASAEAQALDAAAKQAKTQLELDMQFGDMQREARHRLIGATRKSAASEAERDQLLRDDINAEADARKLKIAQLAMAGDLTAARAAELTATEEKVRRQRLQNVDIERASAALRDKADMLVEDRDTQIAILQIEADMAPTAKARRDIELRILELQEERERILAVAVLMDKNATDEQRRKAQATLDYLDATSGQRRAGVEQRNQSPLDEYKARLTRTVGDMDEALEKVHANGLASLEDGLIGIINGTESVAGAFKKMANQIIADLVRIAVQKLILGTLTGGLFGFANGGKVSSGSSEAVINARAAFASGGLISGPGTGTSDSILALVNGQKPILVSNGESIVNARATAAYWPLIQAMNAGKLPGYARGGLIAPRLPAFRPGIAGFGAPVEQHFHVNAQGAVLASDLVAEIRRTGVAAAVGGAEMAQQRMNDRAMATIPQ